MTNLVSSYEEVMAISENLKKEVEKLKKGDREAYLSNRERKKLVKKLLKLIAKIEVNNFDD